jgi:tRNA A37 methylthiotransferase MiaB
LNWVAGATERTKSDLIIGVGGCVASQEGDNIQKRAPYVDMVFGPQTLHRLPQMLDQHQDQVEKPKKDKIKLLIFLSQILKNSTFYLNHVLKV